jgi:predicted RNA binding protein YcfA (HicA-like mRNA interferase family)
VKHSKTAAAVVDGWVATRPRLTNTLTISDHHRTARDRASPVPRSRQTGGPITLAGDNRRGVPAPVRKATAEMLQDWFPTLPPSYRRADRYLPDGPFESTLNILMSQVQEATTPNRDPYEWKLAQQMDRGLFDCQRITHILVPVGQKPLLPWIGHAPALPAVSTRNALRFLEREGWRVAAGRGKGAHIRLKHDGRIPLTIPANRESLSPGILRNIADALGVRVADLRF